MQCAKRNYKIRSGVHFNSACRVKYLLPTGLRRRLEAIVSVGGIDMDVLSYVISSM